MSDPKLPTPPRKRRWGRRLGITFLVLLVLLGIALWAAPGLIAKSGYKDRLIADATKDLNGKVTVGAISLAWFHPVELFDVTVMDADGRKALTAAKVTTSKTLLDFARNSTDLGTITLEKPRCEVVVKGGTTNVEQMLAKYLTGPSKTARPPIRVEATDGTVVLFDADRNETRQIDSVNITVGVPPAPTGPISVLVSAVSNPTGTVKAEGMVGEAGQMKVIADGFDLAALGPILRRFEASTTAAGKLTSNVTVDWKQSGYGVDGQATVADLAIGGEWLNGDVLRLKHADLPVKCTFDGGRWVVDHAQLTCDAGTASFVGTVNTAALDQLFDQSGVKLDADIDAAKVATLLPGLLRVRPGTELIGGRVIVKLDSRAGEKGPMWSGSVNTTKLEARRDGKPLAWDQPLTVSFQGRVRSDGLPVFDKLVVQSDFIGAQARGEPEQFDVIANIELDRLATHLNDFLDLDGLQLSGSVKKLYVQTRPKNGGGYTLTADGTVTNLAVLDKTGKGIREPSLTLAVQADGDLVKHEATTRVRIDTGTAKVSAGADVFDVKLLEPITNVKSLESGKAQVSLTGNLARWRARVGPLVGFPKDWELGGTTKQASAVVTLGETITARQVKLGVTDAVFRGAGLDLAERDLTLETSEKDHGMVTFNAKTGAIAFEFATVTSETVSGATSRFEIKPDAKGNYGANGKWNVVGRLDRVQKLLKMQSDPALADQLRGIARGTVELNAPNFDRIGFVADLKVDQFAYGPPATPMWSEPWVTVKADGEYHLPADSLSLRSATIGRDGFTATGQGRIGKLTTSVEFDLSGDLVYDLAKLEPQLKQYLGKSAVAVGKDTRPFHIMGDLANGGQNLTVAVGEKSAGKTNLTRLNGNAAVAWQSLKAYGFDVGQSELKATMDKGIVTTNPVEATFGGGKVRVEPTLRLNPGAYDLTFKKGKIIESAKLTPAACAEAIGFALPAIANSAQADGTISFELDDNRIPLADPTRGTVKGNLTLHTATVSPGPVVTQVIEVFGLDAPKLHVSKGSVVPVRLENGRVHHANFVVNVGNTPVTTAGSVGVDGSLDLTVSVPIGSTLAEKLVPGNRPIIQKAIASQTVTIAIGGTLTKPVLNREAMRGQLTKIVQGAMKDAVKDAGAGLADDLLKKGLEGLLKPKK